MTIIVLAYVDGSIQNGITGPEYTIPPKITFPTSNRSTFEDVKNEIFRDSDTLRMTISLVSKLDLILGLLGHIISN